MTWLRKRNQSNSNNTKKRQILCLLGNKNQNPQYCLRSRIRASRGGHPCMDGVCGLKLVYFFVVLYSVVVKPRCIIWPFFFVRFNVKSRVMGWKKNYVPRCFVTNVYHDESEYYLYLRDILDFRHVFLVINALVEERYGQGCVLRLKKKY